jgi:DNA-binding protein WhiA
VPFAEDVRAELAEVLPAQEHCRLAQLAGVVRHAGTFHLRSAGAVEVHVDLASSLAARRTVELLRGRGAVCEIRTYREHRFERATRFLIVVAGDARSLQALHEAGVLGPSLAPTERVPARIVSRGCCRRAYLRGAFIGSGSLSRPRSAAHLEWRVSSDTAALQLQELAETEGFSLGVHETPRYWLAYAKSRETIRGLLAALGAHGAELRLEEEGVFAWAREEANRLANADAGNLRRQAAAAARHADAIEQVGGPDALPPELRAVAELRLRLPEATLAELGDAAIPRMTKSAVASRLRRIVQRADL